MPTKIFSGGHGKKRKGESASTQTPKPPRHSGGTSGNLTVKGHKTKTPVVPYSPTAPVTPVQQGIRREKRERRAKAIERSALKKLRQLPAIVDPNAAIHWAGRGVAPTPELKKLNPRAYKKAETAYIEHVASKEGVHADPVAEFAISTAATAGLGGLASLAGKAGAKGVAEVGASLASKEATVGESAAEKGLRAAGKKLSGSPKRVVAKAKAAPGKKIRAVKSAPRRAKATVKAGPKATGKAVGKGAAKHPVRTGYGAAVALPPGVLPGEASERARALATGTVDALINNPIGTGEATGRGVIGAVTGPLALGKAGVESAVEGTPKPLENTAKEQFEGVVGLGKKLLSGNPKQVQKTVEKDVGLSYLAPVPALGRLKLYRDARGRFRSVAQDVRRGIAEKTGSQRMRIAPKGVESHVFGPMENRAARRRGAKRVTRATNPARSQAAHFQKQILENLRKAPVARSLRNVHGMEAGDLLQTLAEYGIRTKDDVAFVRKHGPGVEVPREGMVTLTAALDFADKHPKILTNKHFSKALDAYIESSEHLPAALAGKGRRAKAMAQGDMFGVTRPEDRVPLAAREFTTAKTRAKAWEAAQKREDAIKADRKKARTLADQAQVAKGAERERLKAESSFYYSQAKKAELQNFKLVKALKKYSRPGQALRASARRKFYDNHLLTEYEHEVNAAREKAGLAPAAWTHHAKFKELGDIGPSYPTAASRVEHMRSGKLAAEDQVDRSLRALLSGSVVGPRLRAGGQELARSFTTEEMLPVRIDGQTKHLITKPEWEDAVRSKQYDARHYVLFPARQFKQAMLDPFKSQADLSTLAGSALEKGLKATDPGDKYVVVRREAAKEFEAQISPGHWAGEEVVNKVSQGVSRWLLFSPSWVMIQSVAEAIPMVMAHPELVNPAKIVQLERRIRKNTKLNPTEAKAFAAVAGEAPTALHTPDAFRPELDSNPHGIFSDGARALTKSRLGQGMFSLVRLRPFGVFDNWRQGKYRELLLAAEADKQLNGWVSSLKGALHIQKQISDELRGLPKHEQLAELTKPKYQKLLNQMGDHVINIAGDWQSFTRYERNIAPFLVFYPFLRYSLRWPLTFAKQHPMSATIAAFLGAQNAEQLEKILGHAPSNPLAYAIPVWQDAEGESHLLQSGQRAAPGLSAPTQAIASGQPSQGLSVFNPLIGAGITAATGVNAYTGRQESERGIQAVNQLLATSPIARFFDLQLGEPSTAGKRFKQIEPNKKRNALLTPWEGISAKQFKEAEGFGSDLTKKYADPVASIWDNPAVGEAIYGKSGKGGWIHGDKAPLLKLIKEHKISDKAAKRVKHQEAPFFAAEPKLTPAEEEKVGEALELLQGGILIPTEPGKSSKSEGWRSGGESSEGWRAEKSSSGGWR